MPDGATTVVSRHFRHRPPAPRHGRDRIGAHQLKHDINPKIPCGACATTDLQGILRFAQNDSDPF